MGVYLPYIDMPEDRVSCPLNFGGICCVFVEGENEKGSFPACIGIKCGRIIPLDIDVDINNEQER